MCRFRLSIVICVCNNSRLVLNYFKRGANGLQRHRGDFVAKDGHLSILFFELHDLNYSAAHKVLVRFMYLYQNNRNDENSRNIISHKLMALILNLPFQWFKTYLVRSFSLPMAHILFY